MPTRKILDIYCWPIKITFFRGDLDKKIYMHQLEGFSEKRNKKGVHIKEKHV